MAAYSFRFVKLLSPVRPLAEGEEICREFRPVLHVISSAVARDGRREVFSLFEAALQDFFERSVFIGYR